MRARDLARPPCARSQSWEMLAAVPARVRVAPSALASSVVSALFVDACDHDTPRVLIPRPEVHVVVRLGPSARGGADVHAFGARQHVHRKLLRRGNRALTARLQLGASEAALGVPATSLVDRIVPLDELWGPAATRRLLDRIVDARDDASAAAALERAIGERAGVAKGSLFRGDLALDAARRLARANVNEVAGDLGVSERHLRRVFREALGVSPKAFARLARFERALAAARDGAHASWAGIAAVAGYYDQAHLIAEFRAIAGVTPRALLGELRTARADG